jgi:uncharacterized protein (DUF1501 family)
VPQFDHEKLKVYQQSIRFVAWADELLESVPKSIAVHNQIDRASTSVPLNIAEGIDNGSWDQHGNLKKGHEKNALVTDQPIAALIKDLKQRGLFEETLILWAGEMGRTPHGAGGDVATGGRFHR